MTRFIKIILWMISIIVALLILAIGAISLILYLSRADKVEIGSFDYIVVIPEYAKIVPILSPCKPPLYSYQTFDEPELATIDFGTSASLSEALNYYREFMESRECTFYISEKGNTLGTRGVCKARDIWHFSVTQYNSDKGCFPVSIDLIGDL